MNTLQITLSQALLERIVILAAARGVDAETYVLGELSNRMPSQSRTWRGDWLLSRLRDACWPQDGVFEEIQLAQAWEAGCANRAPELRRALMELVADGLLSLVAPSAYRLTPSGRRWVTSPLG